MKLPYYEVSAFTTNPFGGNPAGICPLDAWLPDAVLLGIAANNNLAETAFTVPRAADLITLDFPSRPPAPSVVSEALVRGLGATPREVFKARDYLAVFSNETEVRTLQPEFAALKA